MNIDIKRMEKKDISNIYKYIHQEYIHKYYPGKEKEEWARHFRWYSFVLHSNSYCFYIIEIDKEFIGTIRYELEENIALISIYLREEYRGKGYGKIALAKSIENILKEFSLEGIEAQILEENEISKKLFLSSGFVRIKKEQYYYPCIQEK